MTQLNICKFFFVHVKHYAFTIAKYIEIFLPVIIFSIFCAMITGKRRRNSKPPEPVEPSENGETETGGSKEIPVPESRTTKKSTKSSNQGRQGSKAKKESSKVSVVADLHTSNSVKSSKNRKNSKKEDSVSKTKKQSSKRQIDLEHVHPSCEEQEHEPSPAICEQEEEQRTGQFF